MSAEMIRAIAQVISAVAWPTIILIVLIMQRGTLGEALRNLESIRVPGGAEIKIRDAGPTRNAYRLQVTKSFAKCASLHYEHDEDDCRPRYGGYNLSDCSDHFG